MIRQIELYLEKYIKVLEILVFNLKKIKFILQLRSIKITHKTILNLKIYYVYWP